MKKLVCLGLFLWTALSAADSAQERFREANRLFESGKYQEALGQYKHLEQKITHWKLYFNAGNACFKLNRFLEAKIYYLKARKWKPGKEEIEHNISIVNHHFKDRISPEKTGFFEQILQKTESGINDFVLVAILLLFSITGNILIFFIIRGNKNIFIRYCAAAAVLFFFLTLVYRGAHINRLQAHDTAVVIKEETEILSGPGKGNTILFKVNPGLELKIRERNQEWLQVTASSQIAGWIEADSLQQI